MFILNSVTVNRWCTPHFLMQIFFYIGSLLPGHTVPYIVKEENIFRRAKFTLKQHECVSEYSQIDQ